MVTMRPRAVLGPQMKASVRARLDDPAYRALFEHLTYSAFQAHASNVSWSDELARMRIAKHAAFLLYLDRKAVAGGVAPLETDEKALLKARVLAYLADMPTSVPDVSRIDEWQYLAEVITLAVQAYDLLAAVDADALVEVEPVIQERVGRWLAEADRNLGFGLTFWRLTRNNITLKTAGAIALAGLVLNHLSHTESTYQPATWVARGMEEIHRTFFEGPDRQSERDVIGGYGEGPWYFRYAMQNVLPLWVALRRVLGDTTLVYGTTEIRTPLFNPAYLRLFEWIQAIRLPDGRLPSIEDTYTFVYFPETAWIAPAFAFSERYDAAHTSLIEQLRLGNTDVTADHLANAYAPDSTQSRSALQEYVLEAAGGLVIKQGIPSRYLYVGMQKGRALRAAGGHNHADATSFLLMADDEPLVYDPGYLRYSQRHYVAKDSSHNLILVNGRGPQEGIPGAARGAEVFLETSTPATLDVTLKYVRMRTAYEQATLRRSFIWSNNWMLTISDHVTREVPAVFTYQFHGNGLEEAGTFVPAFSDHQAEYRGATVPLRVWLDVTGEGTYTTRRGMHERAYGEGEFHTVLELHTPQVTEARFLSILLPDTSAAYQIHTQADMEEHQTGVQIIGHTFTAWVAAQVDTGAWLSVALSPSDTLVTDGSLVQLVSQEMPSGSRVNHLVLEQFRQLRVGGHVYLEADQPVDLQLEVSPAVWPDAQEAFSAFTGYVASDHTQPVTLTFWFASTGAFSVEGAEDWMFDATRSRLSIKVRSGEPFTVRFASGGTEKPVNASQALRFEALYPVPAHTEVTGKIWLPYAGNAVLTVYDLIGRKVFSSTLYASQGRTEKTFSFSVTRLSAGLYVLKANQKNAQAVQVFTVWH